MKFALAMMVYLFTLTGWAGSEFKACQQHQCLAVVDAGSSGSRLHIYAFDLDKTKSPIAIHEVWSKKITPGISTLSYSESELNAYLNRLFLEAPDKKMPIYFYATAGMRYFPAAIQDTLYQRIKSWLGTHGDWQVMDARTISGKEEGVFAWLALNYNHGQLQAIDKPLSGVMDMGGASVQIAFPVQNSKDINAHNIQQVNLYGRSISLFSISFLGLGRNELIRQFIDNPSCYSKNYPMYKSQKGTGEAKVCVKDISVLVNGVHHVNESLAPILAQNPVQNWIVMGGVVYTVTGPGIGVKNGQFTLSLVKQLGQTNLCETPWQAMQTKYPKEEQLYLSCLTASYYYALLANGYGIAPNQPIQFAPSGDTDDWTLGVVLHQH